VNGSNPVPTYLNVEAGTRASQLGDERIEVPRGQVEHVLARPENPWLYAVREESGSFHEWQAPAKEILARPVSTTRWPPRAKCGRRDDRE